MKTKTILLASLLLLGAVAVAPTASAGPVCDMFYDPPTACVIGDAAAGYALCYYNTAIRDWASTCV